MKKGQSTLDYVLLVGIFAAALIAMLVYISRGLQGNLRENSQRLSIDQYDPGNTVINNTETKNVKTIQEAGSTTTVEYGNVNEPNTEAEGLLDQMQTKSEEYSELNDSLEGKEGVLVTEGVDEAKDYLAGNNGDIIGMDPTGQYYIFAAPQEEGSYYSISSDMSAINEEITSLKEDYYDSLLEWAEREKTPDSTSSSSYSSESGETSSTKKVSENLGDL